MKTNVRTTAVSILLVTAALFGAFVSRAADPIRVMLLDGESAGNYHQWKLVTPVLKKQLDALKDGANQVTVLTERKDINEIGTGGIMGPVAIYRER